MKAIAEAPSKAIITGEHFVVHGAWALAAALPMRVRVEVEEAQDLVVLSDRFTSTAPEMLPVAKTAVSVLKEYSIRPRVRVKITSEVPNGAGLGSSASTLVALVSALSRLFSLKLGAERVIEKSMVGEQHVHGRPSGIDPTICTRGGVLLFRRGSRPKRVMLDRPRALIVSYTGSSRSAKGQIDSVSQLRESHPTQFANLTDTVSELSLMAAQRLAEGDMKGLGRLMTINHLALKALGVSSGRLEELIETLTTMGCYGAKLTGAGGGGCVVAVSPKAKEKSIVTGLQGRGFETYRAGIPVDGVRSWLER
jgi:mevalonate kinase